ncbi:MAG: hypothetical protein K0Q51_1279 [Rickettsiaceae bacterium]|jgi:hypothetical protein|nr:hypothetical protein [Rickettsiaceae bacterium]
MDNDANEEVFNDKPLKGSLELLKYGCKAWYDRYITVEENDKSLETFTRDFWDLANYYNTSLINIYNACEIYLYHINGESLYDND